MSAISVNVKAEGDGIDNERKNLLSSAAGSDSVDSSCTSAIASLPADDPATVVVPKKGDLCAVYFDKGVDFFRSKELQERLGGWFPADVATVAISSSAKQKSKKERGKVVYSITVTSDFFQRLTKDKRIKKDVFKHPSPTFQLLRKDAKSGLLVRLVDSGTLFQAQPDRLDPGDLVFGRFRNEEFWYRGRVAAVTENGNGTSSCHIAYDDTDYETHVPFQLCSTVNGSPIVYLVERGAENPQWIMGLQISFSSDQARRSDLKGGKKLIVIEAEDGEQIPVSYEEAVSCLFSDAQKKSIGVHRFPKTL